MGLGFGKMGFNNTMVRMDGMVQWRFSVDCLGHGRSLQRTCFLWFFCWFFSSIYLIGFEVFLSFSFD